MKSVAERTVRVFVCKEWAGRGKGQGETRKAGVVSFNKMKKPVVSSMCVLWQVQTKLDHHYLILDFVNCLKIVWIVDCFMFSQRAFAVNLSTYAYIILCFMQKQLIIIPISHRRVSCGVAPFYGAASCLRVILSNDNWQFFYRVPHEMQVLRMRRKNRTTSNATFIIYYIAVTTC